MMHPLLLLLTALLLGGCTVVEVPGTPGEAEEGDPCVEQGSYACAPDQIVELVCEEGWFVFSQECAGGCTVESDPDGNAELLCAPGHSDP